MDEKNSVGKRCFLQFGGQRDFNLSSKIFIYIEYLNSIFPRYRKKYRIPNTRPSFSDEKQLKLSALLVYGSLSKK
nr:hypothetical protein [uncultured Kingella sp.]